MAKILIIEDDLAFGTMIQTWLRKKGFEVEKATSVGAALRLLQEDSQRDLILSDLRLPDHDGLTTLRWLHKQGLHIPFIVMTSYAEVQNAVLAMKSGANDYVAKPFHPDILLEKSMRLSSCQPHRHLFRQTLLPHRLNKEPLSKLPHSPTKTRRPNT